jgi:signal peptidase I
LAGKSDKTKDQRSPVEGSSAKRTHHEGVRDTIEGLVFAFILAFVARVFVVEAFVIPTGSMAPTLRGAHLEFLCPDCGFRYAVGVESSRPGREYRRNTFNRPDRAVCPNCGWHMSHSEIASGPVRNGDRILVMKYLYMFTSPQRYDVVVFKNPQDPSSNFIKRLAGLPGEVLELIDGQIFTAQYSELDEEVKTLLNQGEYVENWPEDAVRRYDEKLQIARKPDLAQQALWMPVYVADYIPYRPRNLAGNNNGWPRWQPVDAYWTGLMPPDNENGFRTYRFEASDNYIHWLTFQETVEDRYSYNVRQASGPKLVSDFCLSFVITPESTDPTGMVCGVMGKREREFRFELSLDGTARIMEITSSEKKMLAETVVKDFPAGNAIPVRVRFENVDLQVRIWVNGEKVLTADIDWPITELRKHPEFQSPRIALGGRIGSFTISHLKLFRDVYYVNLGIPGSSPYAGLPGHGTQGNPIVLGDAYFVLGDNSPASQDSRLWTEAAPGAGNDYRIGTVPKTHMIGKAFFVYWPSGEPLFDKRLCLIPRVGRMRFIR